MNLFPTTHAARVQPYLWALCDAGVEVEQALARAQLPLMILYDPNLVVPSRKVLEFICKVAREQGIEEIAVLGANREGISNLEPWVKGYLLGAARGGSVCLNRFGAFLKWISDSVMPPPLPA